MRTALAFAPLVLAVCGPSPSSVPTASPVSPCEWCGMADAPARLSNAMRLAPPGTPGDPMAIAGVVRGATGRPAPGVRLYAYQTDAAGHYTPSASPRGNERRHGRLRGWLVTGPDGRYRIETVRPGPYPGRPDPQHVHLAMQAPGDAERYGGEIVFRDDPRLTPAWQAAQRRGGNPFTVCTPVRAAGGEWDVPCDLRAPGREALAAPGAVVGMGLGIGTAMSARGAAVVKEHFVVDTRATRIRWEGYSLRGSHEGTLRAASGWLRYDASMRLVGGEVVVSMTSLEVTDIPASDPVPRRRLRAHLLAEDFFWAERHPTARLVVTSATGQGVGRRRITGRLTMRGVTHPVTFDAAERVLPTGALETRARLRLDRQRWGVRFRRDRDLVVRDAFDLDVTLVAMPRPDGP